MLAVPVPTLSMISNDSRTPEMEGTVKDCLGRGGGGGSVTCCGVKMGDFKVDRSLSSAQRGAHMAGEPHLPPAKCHANSSPERLPPKSPSFPSSLQIDTQSLFLIGPRNICPSLRTTHKNWARGLPWWRSG